MVPYLEYNFFMKIKNIFRSIPTDLKEEVFENIFSNNNIQIERIISKGHTSPKEGEKEWYDQEKDEWVIVLQGEARLSFFDAPECVLKSGDYVHIPAHTLHKVSWTSSQEETIWLAIHYKG